MKISILQLSLTIVAIIPYETNLYDFFSNKVTCESLWRRTYVFWKVVTIWWILLNIWLTVREQKQAVCCWYNAEQGSKLKPVLYVHGYVRGDFNAAMRLDDNLCLPKVFCEAAAVDTAHATRFEKAVQRVADQM